MPSATSKLKLLFLCTGNSCRSQMAEGWTRHLKGEAIEAWSAGIETHGLNPRAVQVMAEAGVDISEQRSKHVDELRHLAFDYVVTVCGHAHESCPLFPARTRVVHVGFADPPQLAKSAHGEAEALACYRRVRDEIRAFVETLPAALTGSEPPANQSGDASMTTATGDTVRETVREKYAAIAQQGSSCCRSKSCCGSADPGQLAQGLGYSAAELAQLPPEANLGLSCGNPGAIAALRPGETVLDLGSGAGLDCFLAGPRVGAAGRAIGVDMTPGMLDRARRNRAAYRERTGLDNVEFRLGEIEHLPVADASVDVVISNCVINLSPDKPQVWREIARVLKPGGRVAVSDMVLKRPIPEAMRESVAALVGCIAGASLIAEVRAMLAGAGLAQVAIEEKSGNLQAMIDTNDAFYRELLALLPPGLTADDYVVSANITARKPDSGKGGQR